MDLFYSKDESGDMTKTGKMCPKDGHEMEKVSASERHTCHWCGGIYLIDNQGKIREAWFEGFE